MLSEGRAAVSSRKGAREAESGTDFARAVSELRVDRGIRQFTRTAFLMRNGQSFLSIPLGRFEVVERSGVDLLREVDPWLDRFRQAGGDKNAPPRFGSALRRIDSAIFDFCKYDGKSFFQKILIALGGAEREMAMTPGKVGQSKFPPGPLAGLSRGWIAAANDGSDEFVIARALAAVQDLEKKIGPLRANLEPVDWRKRCRGWAEKERSVVWNAADLATNLGNVLARRMMDGARAGCERLPLASRVTVPFDTIAAFIAGDIDDGRIEDLIWGLMLIDGRCGAKSDRADQSRDREGAGIQGCDLRASGPLPRAYALLKFLFLPRSLAVDRHEGSLRWRLARDGESGIVIRPEPRILPLLRAGRIGEACRIAAQRLRVSGLPPMPGRLSTGVTRDSEWSECRMEHCRPQRLASRGPIEAPIARAMTKATTRFRGSRAVGCRAWSEGSVARR